MKHRLPSTLYTFCAFTTLGFAASVGPVADLHVVNAQVTPDGFTRGAVTVNGGVEGPLISAKKGDHFRINIINELTDDSMVLSTSIHWHGILQKGLNWVDGAASVSQCPIVPGNSFLYEFTVTDQAGDFWYHSHMAKQMCDGLRGPLVIYDPQDPYLSYYDVDDASTVITLADWYHQTSVQNTGFFHSDSTLINGLGRWNGSTARTPLSVITVEHGKRYRFRLFSMTCESNHVFQIDGHKNLTVIAVDGVNHQPHSVDQMQLLSGQRYSFILEANQPVGNYWIRAQPNYSPPGFVNGINSAILRYVGAPDEDPTSSQDTSTKELVEANLIPLDSPAAPGLPHRGGADVAYNFGMSFNGTYFLMNGTAFTPPTVPVLLQILSGTQNAKDLMPKGSVYSLPSNKVIEISIPANGAPGGPHPWHLHGHTFSVVRSAGSGEDGYNYVNPPRRDVVNAGAGNDNVTIRFVTDNPGPWFLHCHIDTHLDTGLAVVFAEDIQDVPSLDTPTPADWNQLCPAYNSWTP